MNIIKRNSITLVALILLTFYVSACETGGANPVDGVQVIRDMQRAIAAVKSSHANFDVRFTSFPNIKGDLSIEVWQRNPAEVRAELHSVNITGLDALLDDSSGDATPTASATKSIIPSAKERICPATGKPITTTIDGSSFKPSDLQGSILISNGERVWLYTPAICQVYTGSAEQAETTPTQMQAMIDALPGLLDKLPEVADVKGISVEQVGDRAAFKVELTAKPEVTTDKFVDGKVTLWVDQQRNLPLKLVYDGGMAQISISIAKLEVNQSLADQLFRFTVPDGVAVVNLDATKPQSTTLPQARKQANYPILVPSDLPGESVLVGVKQFAISQNNRAADGLITTLTYEGNGVNFDIIEGKAGSAIGGNAQQTPTLPDKSTTEIVMVRGVEAQLITLQDTQIGTRSTLYWNDKVGTAVNINGNLSREEMLKVAESLN